MNVRSIAICADYQHQQYLDVLLKSLQLASLKTRLKLVVKLILKDFPPEVVLHYRNALRSYVRPNFEMRLVKLDVDHQELLNKLVVKSSIYSSTMYTKLLLAKLLPEDDSVLFLDSDTMLLDNIEELLTLPMAEDVSILAVQDHLLNAELDELEEQEREELQQKDQPTTENSHEHQQSVDAKSATATSLHSTHLQHFKEMLDRELLEEQIRQLAVKSSPHLELVDNAYHDLNYDKVGDSDVIAISSNSGYNSDFNHGFDGYLENGFNPFNATSEAQVEYFKTLTPEQRKMFVHHKSASKYQLFNTGVMILNLKRIREQGFLERYLDYLNSTSVIHTPHDQLFLNLIHYHDWLPLVDIYNYQVSYVMKLKYQLECAGHELRRFKDLTSSERENILSHLPKLVHFSGK